MSLGDFKRMCGSSRSPPIHGRPARFERPARPPFRDATRPPFRQPICQPVEREEKKPLEPSLERIYKEIQGSMQAALVADGKVAKVGVAEMINEIKKSDRLDAVVFDGIITQRLVELADSKNIKALVGLKKAKLDKRGRVQVVAMS
jgi:hypothetical protein